MASPSDPREDQIWKRCSTCRKPIVHGQTYYVCSVSTCNRKRTTYRFCTVVCWEEHLPLMRHREAWAVEERAPRKGEEESVSSSGVRPKVTGEGAGGSEDGVPKRRIRVGSAPRPVANSEPGEALVVVSRFKSYVRERFGLNTSDAVIDVLSDHLRAICHRAVDNAREDGRKTIMDRDFEFLRRR